MQITNNNNQQKNEKQQEKKTINIAKRATFLEKDTSCLCLCVLDLLNLSLSFIKTTTTTKLKIFNKFNSNFAIQYSYTTRHTFQGKMRD